MCRLTVCLLLVLVIGSSLAEADNDEQSPKEVDRVDDTGSGTSQVDDKQLGDLAAEDKELKGDDSKPRSEDGQVEDKELKDDAKGDSAVEEEVQSDTEQESVENCQKPHPKRTKHKGKKDKQLHSNKSKDTKLTRTGNKEDEDSTEYDNTTEDESDEDVDGDVLTRASCKDGLSLPHLSSMCCHSQMFLDEDLNECMQEKQSEANAFMSRSQKRKMRALLRIIDCVFRRKKYIRSGHTDRLNIKRIQADADKLNDPERADFMVEMYRSCGSIAKEAVKKFKEQRRQVNRDFRTAHDVFQFMLYVCVDNYAQQQACPHFLWSGVSSSSEAKCAAYAKKCKQLVGH